MHAQRAPSGTESPKATTRVTRATGATGVTGPPRPPSSSTTTAPKRALDPTRGTVAPQPVPRLGRRPVPAPGLPTPLTSS
ncbi:hypothetical protein GCM10009528_18340 [Kineococcus aurantiacus]